MIPYAPQPVFYFGPVAIHAFGVAASAALIAGYWLTLRRARALGLDDRFAAVLFAVCTLAGLIAGFAAGRLDGNGGISSAGLAAGSCLAAWLMLFKSPHRWRYFDVFAFSFPWCGVIARFGCFLAHDHVGARTENWLGVRFPGGTRFDLGLLHCLAMLSVAIAILPISRLVTTPGLPFAVMATMIGVGCLIVSQAADPLGLALILGGLALVWARSRAYQPTFGR